MKDPVPPFSCISSYIKGKDIGLGNIEGPYAGAWNFQGGVFRTIYAPCKNIVMLSCLVWVIWPPFFMYMFVYEAKRHRARKHRRPLPRGMKFSGWVKGNNLRPLFKYSDVILSSLEDTAPPPFSGICSSMKRKVIGLGNIEGPYPGAWNFQDGSKGTIYAPCKNIVMLSCLVWKMRSLHFHVYDLIWSEKSSGSEISKAPTHGPEIFRVGLRGQSSPPVKI